MRLLVAGLAGMALWPATALAGTAPSGGFVLDGPKLAGDQAVWVSGEPGAPKEVRIATPAARRARCGRHRTPVTASTSRA